MIGICGDAHDKPTAFAERLDQAEDRLCERATNGVRRVLAATRVMLGLPPRANSPNNGKMARHADRRFPFLICRLGFAYLSAPPPAQVALKPLYPLDFVSLSATWSFDLYGFTLTLSDQRAAFAHNRGEVKSCASMSCRRARGLRIDAEPL
jgi:hypothetical protein